MPVDTRILNNRWQEVVAPQLKKAEVPLYNPQSAPQFMQAPEGMSPQKQRQEIFTQSDRNSHLDALMSDLASYESGDFGGSNLPEKDQAGLIEETKGEIAKAQSEIDAQTVKITDTIFGFVYALFVDGKISEQQMISKLGKAFAQSGEFINLDRLKQYFDAQLMDGDGAKWQNFVDAASAKITKLRDTGKGTSTSGQQTMAHLQNYGKGNTYVS